MMRCVPSTISPTIPAGTLASSAQPSISSRDGELLLRPWAAPDAAVLYSAFQDSAIRRWHARHMDSPAEAGEWVAAAGRAWRQEQAAQWAVSRAADGAVLGRMALRSMDLTEGLAECAYWVLPIARGAAVASRALAAMAGWALDEAGFHRIELQHSVGNEASCKVAATSGFAWEGTRRSAALHADGWHDMHLHARIQGDA